VSFNGPDRQVSVTGESYFEVAQDKTHPFVVSKGNCAIKVLGTHFNVNAYDEEEEIKVTLLEGAVKVSSGSDNSLLLPGQMAVMDTRQKIDVLKNADIERVVAWKNGYFNFANADIRTVLRELARWYNLELVFNDVTNEKFHVEINRDIPLSKVLRILEMTDRVHFNISGNKVTVTH
jgi:ferric-dicitrate binding protein FerR (iron transport regulator)